MIGILDLAPRMGTGSRGSVDTLSKKHWTKLARFMILKAVSAKTDQARTGRKDSDDGETVVSSPMSVSCAGYVDLYEVCKRSQDSASGRASCCNI